jgi:tRNA(Ile)-lysidine synthetase-like protein
LPKPDPIHHIIQHTLPPAAYIIACSAGPDSVFLAHMMHHGYPQHIHHLVYCNHHLRPTEVNHEIQIVRHLGQQLHMESHIVSLSIDHNSQESFREHRLQALQEIAAQVGVYDVVMGHHLNDDMETLIMQCQNGATTTLRGIPRVSYHGNLRIHHPLLTLPKSNIIAYLNRQKIPFSQDSSNNSTVYVRNRVRPLVTALMQLAPPHPMARSLAHLKAVAASDEDTARDLLPNMVYWNGRYYLQKAVLAAYNRPFDVLKHVLNQQINARVSYTDMAKIQQVFGQTRQRKVPLDTGVVYVDYKWIMIEVSPQLQEPITFSMGITAGGMGYFCITTVERPMESNRDRLCLTPAQMAELRASTIQDGPFSVHGHKNRLRQATVSPIEQTMYPVVYNPQGIVWIPGVWCQQGSGTVVITYWFQRHEGAFQITRDGLP